MRENPIMKYLAETYGITPDQLEEELKNAKIDIGIFVEPWEGGSNNEKNLNRHPRSLLRVGCV